MRLDPSDIETIAQRVAELLTAQQRQAVRYVDAAQVAEILGVERAWVYAHAGQLSAIRLGGPHGRLRFDLDHLRRTLAARPPTYRAQTADRPPSGRDRRAEGGLELLPYRS